MTARTMTMRICLLVAGLMLALVPGQTVMAQGGLALYYQTVQTTCCAAAEAPLTVTCGAQPNTWTCTGAPVPGGDPQITSTIDVASGQRTAEFLGQAQCTFRMPVCGATYGTCMPVPQQPIQTATCDIKVASGPQCSNDPVTYEPSAPEC